MQPQQPYAPAPPPMPQPGPGVPPVAPGTPTAPAPSYDFIINPETPVKHAPLGGLGGPSGSPAIKLLVIVGLVFVAVIVLGVILRLAVGSGGGGFNKTATLAVLQDQTELIRVATVGSQNSTTQNNKNVSITTKLGLTSDQQALLQYASTQHYSPNSKSLGLKHSGSTDTTLTNAQSASTFDQAYVSVMQQDLQIYQRDLSAAYKNANAKTKAVLQTDYEHAQLLLEQLGTNS